MCPRPINVTLKCRQHLGKAGRAALPGATDAMCADKAPRPRWTGVYGAGWPRPPRSVDERYRRNPSTARPIEYKERMPIHRPAPAFDEQSTSRRCFETGVKVGDLIQPFLKAAKSDCSAARTSADRFLHPGTHHNVATQHCGFSVFCRRGERTPRATRWWLE